MKDEIVALLQKFQAGLLSDDELRRRYAELVAGGQRRGAPASQPFARRRKVVLDGPGSVADLRVVEEDVPPPAPRQIYVDTVAFSLNFGDLLCVKGLYPTMPAYPFTPGFEAAGIVRAVGDGVTRFAVGDEVIVTGSRELGMQSSLLIADEAQLVHKPERLSFAQAASFLTVGLTVVEAFRRLQLRAGETILVQSATGGTGLTAVQLAHRAGAHVIATASSQEKLRYLTAMGVRHVINYRERDFEAEVMALTRGKGVDAVLNALPGEAMQKGINCLSPRGRYVEIAMTALKSARSVDLSRMANNQSFFSLDLRKLLLDVPEYAASLGEELFALVDEGALDIVVGGSFAFDELQAAYRQLEERRNIGKVVVTFPGPHTPSVRRPAATAPDARRPATAARREGDEPIAIIGMSGRFGAAGSVDELWACLAEKRSFVTQLPEARKQLFARLPLSPEQRQVGFNEWGSYLDDIDCFDSLFFNISGLEAQHMDPQQRLFLEESWKALEDAGLTRARLDGSRTGVIAGIVDGKYASYIQEDAIGHSFWGTAASILPARVAYFLNLKGPAIAVDTACSSSLVAVHLGCQSLWRRETDLILAGGAFIQSTPQFGVAAGRAQMLASDGKCFTFDDRAAGMVSGEAVAVVVMKRLREARADGDRILGVIVASGVNQDGATNGITAPSAASQQQLEVDVYRRFGIDPAGIQYVEAHGTGTKLGDPIELNALTAAFRAFTDKKQFCAIGSVKPNVGHTVTAAGITGVIKLLLSLRQRQLPGLLNYAVPNRHIDFESSPFAVNAEMMPWTVADGARRRAAVSSFGFSGTNAHVVIEELVPPPRSDAPALRTAVVPLSARSAEQLRMQARNLLAFVERAADDGHLLGDLSYTLQVGREAFEHRAAFVVDDVRGLATRLAAFVATTAPIDGCHRGHVKKRAAEATAPDASLPPSVVAERWTTGHAVDWLALHAGAQPRKIGLPTYPFARERHWAEPSQPRAAQPAPAPASSDGDAGLRALLDDLVADELDLDAAAARAQQLLGSA